MRNTSELNTQGLNPSTNHSGVKKASTIVALATAAALAGCGGGGGGGGNSHSEGDIVGIQDHCLALGQGKEVNAISFKPDPENTLFMNNLAFKDTIVKLSFDQPVIVYPNGIIQTQYSTNVSMSYDNLPEGAEPFKLEAIEYAKEGQTFLGLNYQTTDGIQNGSQWAPNTYPSQLPLCVDDDSNSENFGKKMIHIFNNDIGDLKGFQAPAGAYLDFISSELIENNVTRQAQNGESSVSVLYDPSNLNTDL